MHRSQSSGRVMGSDLGSYSAVEDIFWKNENALSRAHQNIVVSGTLWILAVAVRCKQQFSLFLENIKSGGWETAKASFFPEFSHFWEKLYVFCQIWWNIELQTLFKNVKILDFHEFRVQFLEILRISNMLLTPTLLSGGANFFPFEKK